MKIENNKTYLIRQIRQDGIKIHDNILAVKLLRRATKEDNQINVGNSLYEGGFIGENVKNNEEYYFKEREIICQLN